ncbi:MAG: hypothetical protein AB1489_35760 [Acidobacteriota bacterium]
MRKTKFYSAVLALVILMTGVSLLFAQNLSAPLADSVGRLARLAVTSLPNGTATDANNNFVLSRDGRVGFLSTAFGDSVYAFDTTSGELLASARTGERAAHMALFDNGQQRRLAVVNLNAPGEGQSSAITVLDASFARRLTLLSAFILPTDVTLSPFINPIFTKDGKSILIASEEPAALFLFDTETGQMHERIPLDEAVTSLAVAYQGDRSIIGVVSPHTHSVTILEIDKRGQLRHRSFFALPQNYGLLSANNLCFNQTGTIGYLASFEGDMLFSFDTETGIGIDSFEVGDAPGRVAWFQLNGKARLAVVNTGLEHGFLADSVSIIETGENGRFGTATVFLPAVAADLIPDSVVEFSSDGRFGFVGTLNNFVFAFDTLTGEQLGQNKLKGQATKLAAGRQGGLVVALASSATAERITVLRFERDQTSGEAQIIPLGNEENANLSLAYFARIRRIRRGLRLSVEGEGFTPNTELFVNERKVPSTRPSEQQLVSKISWGFLGRTCEMNILIKDNNGLKVELKKSLRRRNCPSLRKVE